jgi:hypothetical protein
MKEREEDRHQPSPDSDGQREKGFIIRRAGLDSLGIEPGIVRDAPAGELPETSYLERDQQGALTDDARSDLVLRLTYLNALRWRDIAQRAGNSWPFGIAPADEPDDQDK